MSKNKISIQKLFEYVEDGEDKVVNLEIESSGKNLPKVNDLEKVILDYIDKEYVMHFSIEEDLKDLEKFVREKFENKDIFLHLEFVKK